MTEASHSRETGEHLVTMANDIANYFRPQGREEAIAGIATHIKRYWTVRMRQKLNAYLAQGHGADLDQLPRAAVDRLNEQAADSNQAAGSTGAADEEIGRPGPWGEGRYQRRGDPLDQSVRTPPGTSPNPDATVSTPVTRKDYELPGQQDHGDADPPGGDGG